MHGPPCGLAVPAQRGGGEAVRHPGVRSILGRRSISDDIMYIVLQKYM